MLVTTLLLAPSCLQLGESVCVSVWTITASACFWQLLQSRLMPMNGSSINKNTNRKAEKELNGRFFLKPYEGVTSLCCVTSLMNASTQYHPALYLRKSVYSVSCSFMEIKYSIYSAAENKYEQFSSWTSGETQR